jgi:hypothetical protein
MLRREAIGSFTLAQAHTLEAIEERCHTGALGDWLLPPGTGLPLPAHTLNEEELRRMGHGQIVLLAAGACDGESMLAAAYDEQGQFAGIIHGSQECAACTPSMTSASCTSPARPS